jgi:hypothetical protein
LWSVFEAKPENEARSRLFKGPPWDLKKGQFTPFLGLFLVEKWSKFGQKKAEN